MAAEDDVVPFMAFHLLGILDGVGLVILVRSEALAVVAYLSFQMLQFCFRLRCGGGRTSGYEFRFCYRRLNS